MRWLLTWLLHLHMFVNTVHPCRPCQVKAGPLPDAIITLQPATPQEQMDTTPDDNDGGSDETPAVPSQ